MNQEFITQRNNVTIKGRGNQTMLFAHGFGCDQNMWRFITPAFEDHYRLILFDYVGAGTSDVSQYNSERYDSLTGYAQDILDICEVFDLSDVIFIGHSVSSMIGLLASIKDPSRFSRLLFVSPSARYLNDEGYIGGFEKSDILELLDTMDKNYIGWANFLAPAIMGNPENPELGTELVESFCSTDPKIARQFAEVTFLSDNRDDLEKSTVPTLILQCSDDMIAPVEVGQFLNKNISDSWLEVMNATGHCPHLSAPEETIRLISKFLEKA